MIVLSGGRKQRREPLSPLELVAASVLLGYVLYGLLRVLMLL